MSKIIYIDKPQERIDEIQSLIKVVYEGFMALAMDYGYHINNVFGQSKDGKHEIYELRDSINTLSYERTGLSKNKKLSFQTIANKIKPTQPADAIKDFYFFNFLELPNIDVVDESQLETALLNHLEKFILELGNGFCFEARQKRILIGDEYFFIDMVFIIVF